ncbi:MAG: sulfatase-like hydrolase/transferase [Sedimentisphaerales bacterium]|nr:sulfatase-like hydrolase/transferase [Sedimentisphaerales bacterium]
MTRRGFLGMIGCGAVAMALPRPVARPNLILLLIDDQDKPSIGAYGGKTWTPNLDRMAREGMRFTQAHVSSTVCTPSRYSFLTGRYAGNSYSKLYTDACGTAQRQGYPNFNVALESDRMNVGRVLSEAGYATGFVGKYHLTSRLDQPEFFEGADGLLEIPKTTDAGPQANTAFRRNERAMRRYIESIGFSWAKHIYPGNMQRPYAQHNPEWTVQAALEFIEANRNRPFYLHCCPTLLHGGEGSWRKSMDHPLVSGEGRLDALPEVMTPRAKLLDTVERNGFDSNSPTAGEAWIDDALGAIVNQLKALGIDDNTLIVFAPDHGRAGKASLFSRNGTCIPCLARWPSRIRPGLVSEELVQNIDWAPTFFELAGARVPKDYRLDGRSLVPLFDNGKARPWRDHLYFEMGAARAVATKDWKYIAVRYTKEQVAAIQRARPESLPRLMSYIGRLGIGVRGAERPGFFDADQLYDLRRDPDEMNNLAASPEYASQLKEMRRLLREDLRRMHRPFGEFVPGDNTAPSGLIDEQIALVKRIKIEGKNVLVPRQDAERNSPRPRRPKRHERRSHV